MCVVRTIIPVVVATEAFCSPIAKATAISRMKSPWVSTVLPKGPKVPAYPRPATVARFIETRNSGSIGHGSLFFNRRPSSSWNDSIAPSTNAIVTRK
jgi:hypothetical protein